jgi:hypothetical protein
MPRFPPHPRWRFSFSVNNDGTPGCYWVQEARNAQARSKVYASMEECYQSAKAHGFPDVIDLEEVRQSLIHRPH